MKPKPTKQFLCNFLCQYSFPFSTIIDVGCQYQTKELRVFSEAKHILIEPDPQYFESIHKNYSKLQYKLLDIGCAEFDSKLYLHRKTGGSDLNSEKSEISVRVKSLDTVFAEENIQDSALLKIDVDGLEVDILNGAKNSLAKCAFVIIEAKMPAFNQISNILHESNFSLCHIVDLCYKHNVLAQCDLVFVNNAVKNHYNYLNPPFTMNSWHKHC
jgi:FkbM family methyltransferase